MRVYLSFDLVDDLSLDITHFGYVPRVGDLIFAHDWLRDVAIEECKVSYVWVSIREQAVVVEMALGIDLDHYDEIALKVRQLLIAHGWRDRLNE